MGERLKSWKTRAVDWGTKFATAQLVKLVGGSAFAVAVAAWALPVAAAISVSVAVSLLIIYAIYSTRAMKRLHSDYRRAWIVNKRLQQKVLEQEIVTDNVILELLGHRTDSPRHRHLTNDVRAALSVAIRRAEDNADKRAASFTPPRPARAARRFEQGSSRPRPLGPDDAKIKARRDARVTERDALEAEIQSLQVPGNVELAMRAEEANRTARERRNASVKADQVARERVRRGRTPTKPRPESVLEIRTSPFGQDIRTSPPEPAPEQIAAGEA